MNPRNHDDNERQLQEMAEQAERTQHPASGDARLDQYRLVVRALARPLPAALPDDFPAQVMRRIHRREQRSAREDVIVTGLLLLLAALGLALAYPYLLDGIDQFRANVPMADALAAQVLGGVGQLPWQMLGIAGVGIGAALTLERWLSRPTSPTN